MVLYRRILLAPVASVILFLAVVPVHAAPSLALGSTSSYSLDGSLKVGQSCTADIVSYASQACGGPLPPPPQHQSQTFFSDDFNYGNISEMVAAGWTLCGGGAPVTQYHVSNGTVRLDDDGTTGAGVCRTDIPQGVVDWAVSANVAWVGNPVGDLGLSFKTSSHNYLFQADGYNNHFDLQIDGSGQSVIGTPYTGQLGAWHLMRAEMYQNILTLYFDGAPVITSNESGPTNLTLFAGVAQWDTNNAYDWIQAATLGPVIPQPTPTPMPTSMEVGLTGSLSWKVEGLSSTQANLRVSHNIAVSVSPIPLITFTPVTESGSFDQSINLSTRVESQGTASNLATSVLNSVLPAMTGLVSQTGTSAPIPPSVTAMLAGQSADPEYTIWWVNGPLSNGSPVQIAQGWSSVTGTESLNLGGSIGTRQAWLVTSQLSQNFNLNVPNPNDPLGQSARSTATGNLDLLWSYDKTADLLLRSNSTLSVSVLSVTPTTIYPNGCNQYSCNPNTVSVTHIENINVAVTMQLTSTSLTTGPSSQAPSLNSLATMPWMPLGLVGVGAGALFGLFFWLEKRARRPSAASPIPVPSPAPTAP